MMNEDTTPCDDVERYKSGKRKTVHAAAMRRYYEKNKDKLKQARRQHYYDHREAICEKQKQDRIPRAVARLQHHLENVSAIVEERVARLSAKMETKLAQLSAQL
jgi:exonuclease VII large subunit